MNSSGITNNAVIYRNGVSLQPDSALATYSTKQHTYAKVFLAEEGEVTPKSFKGGIYIVMVSMEVLDNIFRCEHDIDEETGFDQIELCRPNI